MKILGGLYTTGGEHTRTLPHIIKRQRYEKRQTITSD